MSNSKNNNILYYPNWSKEEDNILIREYPRNGINIPLLLRRRTVNAIRSRVTLLRIKMIPKYRRRVHTKYSLDCIVNNERCNGKNTSSGKFCRYHCSQYKNAIINKHGKKIRELKKERWPTHEKDLVKRFYETLGTNIPGLEHRDKCHIKDMAKQVGTRYKGKRKGIFRKVFKQCIVNNSECTVYKTGRFCGIHISRFSIGAIDINGNEIREVQSSTCDDCSRIVRCTNSTWTGKNNGGLCWKCMKKINMNGYWTLESEEMLYEYRASKLGISSNYTHVKGTEQLTKSLIASGLIDPKKEKTHVTI